VTSLLCVKITPLMGKIHFLSATLISIKFRLSLKSLKEIDIVRNFLIFKNN
jgi:hypothetical protein